MAPDTDRDGWATSMGVNKWIKYCGLVIATATATGFIQDSIQKNAGCVGLQTVSAAAETEKIGALAHESLWISLKVVEEKVNSDRTRMFERLDLIDEAIIELLEMRSPSRAMKHRLKRSKLKRKP